MHLKQYLEKNILRFMLALLWLFVMLNYIYADIMTLMDASVLKEMLTGAVDGMEITPTFLFFGAILMEIPIAMVVLSLVLKKKVNRWVNISAGAIKSLAVFGTLFVGVPTLYYSFFAVIEIITTLCIIYIAFKWYEPILESEVENTLRN